MLIQCTKKLLDELKVSPGTPSEENALFDWHANVIKIGRKKVLVLVNDLTRYVIVLYGVKAKDLKHIDKLISQALEKVWQAENIKDEIIQNYLQQANANEITFSKTKDRTSVARLNKACENAHYFEDLVDEEVIIQEDLSLRISSMLAGNGKSYIHPNEEMYKSLEEFAGESAFNSEAVELNVTLKLDHRSVWRKLVVPMNTTFSNLHHFLQVAFGWQNSHLHDFIIYPDFSGENVIPMNQNQATINLVCSEEAFNYPGDIPMKMETGVKLFEYLPAKIVYNYDFGDDWEHVIEVEKVVDNYKVNYPICLDGEGNAPPEDVGGEGGYEEFLQIIGDPNHPDYQHMISWGKMQGYKEFDLKDINFRLKMGL
ncbi:plasmid pRiA4b ORF-3 family protein [Bacillus sp. NTK071]|uniref:plasmid pRiA4b ORF-3 family protein n=1 Tax=Bacillus sp. NTK071 TaxID=2802175 RepID=UPI001A8FB345|nr:plasmid pRiA4b ORF-3 family protein [Bacillus sp. NTK071]MBN8209792.1 plasmid pRiA4b ORF-3 family protein [Bacillus sp. NTK071]